MPYCDKCGKELRAGAKFCEECGATVEEKASSSTPVVGGIATAREKTVGGERGKKLPLILGLVVLMTIVSGVLFWHHSTIMKRHLKIMEKDICGGKAYDIIFSEAYIEYLYRGVLLSDSATDKAMIRGMYPGKTDEDIIRLVINKLYENNEEVERMKGMFKFTTCRTESKVLTCEESLNEIMQKSGLDPKDDETKAKKRIAERVSEKMGMDPKNCGSIVVWATQTGEDHEEKLTLYVGNFKGKLETFLMSDAVSEINRDGDKSQKSENKESAPMVEATDQDKFTMCLESLSGVKVAEEMYITDNGTYTTDKDLLAINMIAGCTDPQGKVPACRGQVNFRVKNNCDKNTEWEITTGGTGDLYSYYLKATAGDRYRCKICVSPNGYRPTSYQSCGSSQICP